MRTVLLVAVILFPALARGQSSICIDANAEVVFVGRAEPRVTFHVSGEAVIERARRNLELVKEQAARERAALDPQTQLERAIEFEVRIIKASDELEHRQAMYPPPYDLSFIPLQVENGIRGVTESTVMVFDRPLPTALEPGQRYLITGYRSTNLLPPLPEMGDLSQLDSYIDAIRVTPAGLAQKEVAFLEATRTGAAILGTLRRHSWATGLPPPIGGTRVVVSSSGQVREVVTNEDGSFAVFGVPAGRIVIEPVLPPNLTIFNRSALNLEVREGQCAQVQLMAEVNGRVRGRIVSASGRSLKGVTLHLNSISLTEFRLNSGVHRASSHSPRLDVAAAEDGTFEFVGVPPGDYLLTAGTPVTVNGKPTTLTTFYPGTSEQSSAVPITVGNATEHDGFDFVIRME